jgi:hypothetical protein
MKRKSVQYAVFYSIVLYNVQCKYNVMTDASDRILILSALILVAIILLSPSLLMKHVSIGSWTMRDLIDPELALEHGFKGYVNVSYVSETPARIIVSPGKIVNYTIQLKLIPHVPEFMETEVVLDPENSSKHGVGWGEPVPIFNDYIRYSPIGSILLCVDEPRNVTMILSVPEGMTGMSAYHHDLLGVGIKADIPIVYEGGGHLDRIH